MRQIFALFFLFALGGVGCSRPDPHPELKDVIYLDYVSELQLAEKNIVDLSKTLEEHKKSISEAKPQTGQNKWAEKRFWETKNTLSLFEQQRKYWIIRIDQRRDHVRQKALRAFHEGRDWIDPKEISTYEAEKRLRQAKNKWDVRERRESFLRENQLPLDSTANRTPANN